MATPDAEPIGHRARRTVWQDNLVWAAMLVGIVAAVASWMPLETGPAQWLAARSLPFVSPDLVAPPRAGTTAGVAVGLLVYFAGLFAPLRPRD
jgi:hypothetical protein